jgi:Ubiquitin carboxyl-terminal hydrolase
MKENLMRYVMIALIYLLSDSPQTNAWPPSLDNCANTCFINASLQSLYAISPLTILLSTKKNPFKKIRTRLFDKNDLQQKSTHNALYWYVELIKKFELSKKTIGLASFPCASYLKNFIDSAYGMLDAPYELLSLGAHSQEDATEFIGKFLNACITLDPLEEKALTDPYNAVYNQAHIKRAINKLFGFKMQTISKCPIATIADKIELYIDLPLATINEQSRPLTSLAACLTHFFRKEKNVEIGTEIDCTQQLTLSSLAYILPIALKRYNKYGEKLSHRIAIPLEIDMAPYARPGLQDYTYELIAAIIQGGGTSSGHYWAYVKEQEIWYKCNDSIITMVKDFTTRMPDDIAGSGTNTGYFFLYKNKNMKESELLAELFKETANVGNDSSMPSPELNVLSFSVGELNRSLTRLSSLLNP